MVTETYLIATHIDDSLIRHDTARERQEEKGLSKGVA